MGKNSSSWSAITRQVSILASFVQLILLCAFTARAENFTARHVNDYGNVTIMEVTGNYNAEKPDGTKNVEPRQIIAKEFFKTHKDEYDFLVLFTNFNYDLPRDAVAFYQGVRNDVHGIGRQIFDNSSFYGSNGKLQGTIDMGSMDAICTDPLDPVYDFTLDTLAHEMLHRWASYVKFRDWNNNVSGALLGKDGSHWSYLLDTKGSLEYGNQWRDNADGTFTSNSIQEFYSPLDLYLMGMIDKSQVPPMLLIDNPSIDPVKMSDVGVIISGIPRSVSIDDIIAVEGERIPNAVDSQKQFKMAFIFVTAPGTLTVDELNGIETVRNGFLTRYSILTDGKALVQVASTLKDDVPVNPGISPPVTVPRVLPHNIDDGVKWLTSHQQSDGSWSDLNLTSERDTAEVVTSLQRFAVAQSQFQAGLAWLGSSASANTDFLTRRLEAVVRSGGDGSSLVQQLLTRRNPDGGWSSGRYFLSSAADTALALRSLALAGYVDRQIIDPPIAFLKGSQNGDGGWSCGDATSAIQPTAAVVSAFNAYRRWYAVDDALTRAVTFLAGKQNEDGGFGNSQSTIYDTAQVVLALQEAGAGNGIIRTGLNYLTRLQGENGSWSDSSYQTAVAVRAVWQATVEPDLSIKAEDINFIPEKVMSLPTNAVLQAKVWNLGQSDVPQASVALYNGDIIPENMVAQQTLAFPGQSPTTVTFTVPITNGKGLLLHVVVDPHNLVEESDKNNNSAVKSLLPEITYDFEILPKNIAVSANPVDIGKEVKVSVEISNRGTVDAFNVPVRFFIDIPGAPFEIATLTMDVPAGGYVSREILWKTSKAGLDLPLTVQVDPYNYFTEINKENNKAATQLTVNGSSLPNLAVSYKDIVITPNPGSESGNVNISVLVRNDGVSVGNNVKVVCYNGVPGHGGVLLGSRVITEIPVGQGASTAFNWLNITESGEKVIFIRVDPDDAIQEITKDDNDAFIVLPVRSLPDLSVSANSMTFSPSAPKDGDIVTFSVVVQNKGDQNASDVPVQIREGATLLGSQTIPLIKGNGQETVMIDYDTTGRSGSHQIQAVVDPDGLLVEQNRENNSAVRTFVVQNGQLWVSEPYFSPNGDGVKDYTQFSFRLDSPTTVEVNVIDRDGEIVRTFKGGELNNTTGMVVTWDGLNDSGMLVSDGVYRLEVRDTGNGPIGNLTVTVDNNRSPLLEAVGTEYFYHKDIGCSANFSGAEWVWLNDDSGFIVTTEKTYDSVNRNRVILSSLDGGLLHDITPLEWYYPNYEIRDFTRQPNGAKVTFFIKNGAGCDLFLWDKEKDLNTFYLGNSFSSGKTYQKWSGDGTKLGVGFDSNATPYGYDCSDTLYTISSNGEAYDFRQMTNNMCGPMFDWSPDNASLAYVNNKNQVIISDLSGSVKSMVYAPATGTVAGLHWIDVDRLLLSVSGYGTFVLNINDKSEQKVSDYAYPSLAPDKKKMLIQTADGADVVALDGVLITRYSSLANEVYESLSWSPDSRYISVRLYHSKDYPLVVLGSNSHSEIFLPCEERLSPVQWFDSHTLAYASQKEGLKIRDVTSDETNVIYSYGDIRYRSSDINFSVSPLANYLSWSDPYSYSCENLSYHLATSLLNLTGILNAVKGSSAVTLKGTAMDANFGGWRLEYADALGPIVWNLVTPSSENPVMDGEFATWVPPAEGMYRVRLTVWDKAGNQMANQQQISWGLSPIITNIYKTNETFSPTGDGVKDITEIHYQLMAPGHLEFFIRDGAGKLVKTIRRDYAGPIHDYITWDGRDETGMVVPDGNYSISVMDSTFHVTVDTLPPEVSLRFSDVSYSEGDYVVNALGHATDRNPKKVTIEYGIGESPQEWLPLNDLDVPEGGLDGAIASFRRRPRTSSDLTFKWLAGKKLRLTAEDKAGNLTTVVSDRLSETIIVDLVDHEYLLPELHYVLPPGFRKNVDHILEGFVTVAFPLSNMVLQYGRTEKVGNTFVIVWRDVPSLTELSVTDPGEFKIGFLDKDLPHEAEKLRVKGVNADGREIYSYEYPVFALFSLKNENCKLVALNNNAMQVIRFQIRSTGDGSYTEWTDYMVLDDVRFISEGKNIQADPPTTFIKSGETYSIRMTGRTLSGVDIESSSIDFPFFCSRIVPEITYPQASCGNISGAAKISADLSQVVFDAARSIIVGKGPVTDLTISLKETTSEPYRILKRFDHAAGVEDELFVFLDTRYMAEGRYPIRIELGYQDAVSGTNGALTGDATLLVERTLPVASITYPSGHSTRVCPVKTTGILSRSVVPVEGVATDESGVDIYQLFFSSDDNAASWFPATTPLIYQDRVVQVPITGTGSRQGKLGVWDITGLQDMNSSLHLKVVDRAGNVSCATTAVSIDKTIEILSVKADRTLISSGGDGVSREVSVTYEIDESASVDVMVHRLLDNGSLDGLPTKVLVSGKVNQAGMSSIVWDGRNNNGAVVQDGRYAIAVYGTDGCDNVDMKWIVAEVDNTLPVVEISQPKAVNAPITGNLVEVKGTVADTHFRSYLVEIGEGNEPLEWKTIGTGSRPVSNGVLASWNSSGLQGRWAIRLSATDLVGNNSSTTTTVDFGTRNMLIKDVRVMPQLYSPNGDGKIDTTTVTYEISDACRIEADFMDSSGAVIRRYAPLELPAGVHQLNWDGRTDGGTTVADGTILVRLSASLLANAAVAQTETISVVVDTTPPLVNLKQPVGNAWLTVNDVTITGTIDDPNLREYSVAMTGPAGMQVVDAGSQSRIDYSFGVLKDLVEGDYTLTVMATDQVENGVLFRRAFAIDRTPPMPTLNQPKNNDYYGGSKNVIEVTGLLVEKNLGRYTVRYGAGETPTEWKEVVGGETAPTGLKLASLKVGKDDGIADGIYTLSLHATDRSGLEGEAKVTVVIDNTAPLVTISSFKEGDYVKGPIDIKGTIADTNLGSGGLELSENMCSKAGKWVPLKSFTKSVADGVLGTWQLLPADGDYCLRLTALDKSDNKAETKISVIIDTHPPASPQLTGKVDNKTNIVLTWTRNSEPDLAGYNVYRDGTRLNAALLPDVVFLDAALKEGTYSYIVKAVDLAGNESEPSSSAKLRVDVVAPTVRIAFPQEGATVSGLVDIMGTAFSVEDFKEYRLYIGQGSSPSAWQQARRSPLPTSYGQLAQWNTTSLPQGETFAIKLEGEDIYGNIATQLVSVTVDNAPPSVPLLLTAVSVGADVSLTWHVNNESDLAGYLLYRNDQLANASGLVISDTKPYLLQGTSHKDLALPDGTFTYYLVAMDKAGNTSARSNSLTTEIDTRRPHATITEPKDGDMVESTAILRVESPDKDLVSVRFLYRKPQDVSWLDLGPPVTKAPFVAYFDPESMGLTRGVYQFMAVAGDKAGPDPAPAFITLSYTDLTAPESPVDLQAKVIERSVSLSWAGGSEKDLDGYSVYRTSEGIRIKINASLIKSHSYQDENLADGVYSYEITAMDTSGNESISSTSVSARIYRPVLTQPYSPVNKPSVTISGTNATPGSAVEFFRNSDMAPVSVGMATADSQGNFVCSECTLVPGLNKISARTTDKAGNVSRDSDVAAVVCGLAPPQPTGVAALARDFTVDLTWNPNQEVDLAGYSVYRRGAKLNTPQPLSIGVVTASAYLNDNYHPALAFDADPVSAWMSPFSFDKFTPVWWELDLPRAELINHLDIHWRHDAQVSFAGRDFEVQAWMGGVWITLAKVMGNTANDNSFIFSPSYPASRIRIAISETNFASFGKYVAINEVGIMKENLIAQPPYQDTNLSDGKHGYSVTAVSSLGFESPLSEEIAAEVGDVIPPAIPKGLVATPAVSSVNLGWLPNSESDLAGYNVYRKGTDQWMKLNSGLVTAPTFSDQNLVNGTYVYRIKAMDQAGNESDPSIESTATIMKTLPQPGMLAVTTVPQGKALELQWALANGDSTGHAIYRSISSGGPYQRIVSVANPVFTYQDCGLENGATYYYVVKAVDAIGNEGAPSNEVSGIPVDAVPPPAPLIYYPVSKGGIFRVSQDTITVAGAAEPGSMVELLSNGSFVGKTAALQTDSIEKVRTNIHGYNAVSSPDGRLIAYIDINDYGLKVKNLATNLTTSVAGRGSSQVWSPSGDKIAYQYVDPFGSSRIGMYCPETGKATALTADQSIYEEAPSWSGDGSRIAYKSNRDGPLVIWIKDLATGAEVNTGLAGNSPTFSPDGKKIAYFDDVSLFVASISDGWIKLIDDNTDAATMGWSADSSMVVFESYLNGAPELYVVDITSGEPFQVSNNDNEKCYVSWSPSGQSIAYGREEGNACKAWEADLKGNDRMLGIDGDMSSAQWTRKGNLLLFERNELNLVSVAPRGSFAFDNVELETGENVLTATAADDAGNISPFADAVSVFCDTTLLPDISVGSEDIYIYPLFPKPGEEVILNVAVNNRGRAPADNVGVEIYLWDSSGNLQRLKSATIAHMDGDASEDVGVSINAGVQTGAQSLIVLVDPAGMIQEQLENNNIATSDFYVTDREEVTVKATLDAARYAGGQEAIVTVAIGNSGKDTEGLFTVTVKDIEGIRVALLDSATATIHYGTENRTYRWSTGATLAGPYQVHAVFTGPDGSVVESRADFTILPDISVDAAIVTDKQGYGANENVGVVVTLRNSGSSHVIPQLKVRMRIVDPTESELFAEDKTVQNLFPGTYSNISSEWNTSMRVPGNYRAVVEGYVEGRLVLKAAAVFTVKAISLVSGTVALDATTVGIGNDVKLTFVVSNSGNSSAVGTAKVAVTDPDSQAIVATATLPVDLPVNGSQAREFTFPTTGLQLKRHQVSLQYISQDIQKVIASTAFTVVDDTPPVMTVVSPQEGTTHVGTVTLTVLAKDNASGVERVEYQLDGGAWKPMPLAGSASGGYGMVWSPTVADNGTHSISFRATDRSQNASTSVPVTFTFRNTTDITAPKVVASPKGGGYKVGQDVTLSADESATIFYTIDGTPPTIESPVYSQAIPIMSDATLKFFARDLAGNDSDTGIERYAIDTTPPRLAVSTLTDGSYTNNDTLNISGTLLDDKGIKELLINGISVPVNDDGSFSSAIILQTGENSVTVSATDLVGNKADDSRTIYLDETAPYLVVDIPADNSKTGKASVDVKGKVDETSVVVMKLKDAVQNAAVNNGEFSETVVLSPGENTIEVTATDLAGNPSTVKRTVLYDDQKPAVAITFPNQDIRTNQSIITLKGTATDSFTAVTVTIAMDDWTFTPLVINGVFEQELAFPNEKSYAIIATAKNEVGASTRMQRNIIYDTTPPKLAINPVISPTDITNQRIVGTRESDATIVVTCASATVGGVSYPTPTEWYVGITGLSAGDNVIMAIAEDSAGNRSTATATITLQPRAPCLHLSATPDILWPPDHRMVKVRITGSVDGHGTELAALHINVADEYGKYNYRNLHFGDTVLLEAWRDGKDKNGRIYTITATVVDTAGNKTAKSITVTVPHDMEESSERHDHDWSHESTEKTDNQK